MSDRQYPFIRADARVSRFAALAPIAAALEQWGTGVWHDIGEIGFAAIWVALAAIVLVEVVVAGAGTATGRFSGSRSSRSRTRGPTR